MSTAARALSKLPPRVPRPKGRFREISFYRLAGTMGGAIATCWIPVLIFKKYWMDERVNRWRTYYSNMDPDKEAWDFVYDYFPGRELLILFLCSSLDDIRTSCYLRTIGTAGGRMRIWFS